MISFANIWERMDEQRNNELDKTQSVIEQIERCEMTALREAKLLWGQQRDKRDSSVPMSIFKPDAKPCMNDFCNYEVNGLWAHEKNWCAGDRCVQVSLGPYASTRDQQTHIRDEMTRYFTNLDRDIESSARQNGQTGEWDCTFEFDSPTSITASPFLIEPMDLEDFDLLREEDLIFDIEELECDPILNDTIDLTCHETLENPYDQPH